MAGFDLSCGRSLSCGCLKRDSARQLIKLVHQQNTTHGHTAKRRTSAEYRSWGSMRDRCNNPKNDRYKDYGGRGIKVCTRWNSFANFLADMGKRPFGYSLDRINNDGNYEPCNCRWATPTQQQRNGRRVKIVSRNGIRGSFRDVCDALGVSAGLVSTRLRRGWQEDDAWTRKRRKLLS